MRLALSRPLVILVAIVAVTATQASGETLIEVNDGGSGGDAPSTIANALRLPGPGTYQGGLKGVDTDWYVHGPGISTGACTDLKVSAKNLQHSELRILTPSGYKSLRVTGTEVRYGLAATTIEDIYVGLVSTPDNNGNSKYQFTSAVSGLTATGENGGDAGSQLSGAVPLAAGCTGGALTTSTGDHKDLYSFSGRAGDKVVFSFVHKANGDTLLLSLLRPDGSMVTSVGSNQLLAETLGTDGTWFLSVERASTVELTNADTSYVLGDCKPHCVIL